MPNRDPRALPPDQYATYIASAAWRSVRQRWVASKYPKVCARCFKPWGKGDHLHHRTYKRLGVERLIDLVPLCEPCHQAVHERHRSMGGALWGVTGAMVPLWGRYCQEVWAGRPGEATRVAERARKRFVDEADEALVAQRERHKQRVEHRRLVTTPAERRAVRAARASRYPKRRAG